MGSLTIVVDIRHGAGRPGLVDVHSHILPGIDDGATDIDAALELARTAAAGGVCVIAATPHVRPDHPRVRPAELGDRCAALGERLAEAGVAVLDGLAHVLASDAHGATGPAPPDLPSAVHAALAIVGPRARWMATEAPAAILAGRALPPSPSSDRAR